MYFVFSCIFVTVSALFCGEVFETFIILLLPIKSPVASFLISLFEVVLNAYAADCLE